MLGVLRSRTPDVAMLDHADYPEHVHLSAHISPHNAQIHFSTGQRISSQVVHSVLCRRRRDPVPSGKIVSAGPRDYVVKECTHLLESLSHAFPAYWVNNPDSTRVASRKLLQLQVALDVGFRIPRTIITSSPDEAKQFISNLSGDVAIKALFTPGISSEDAGNTTHHFSLYTTRLSRESALININRVRHCPVIIQEYVEKAFELRITVVGDRVFSCAIYSQRSSRSNTDWRRYDLDNTPHESITLPRNVESMCCEVCRRLGLVFGCIDMIVTSENGFVFLEINPSGQWLWIERLTQLPISEAIADLLCNPPYRLA